MDERGEGWRFRGWRFRGWGWETGGLEAGAGNGEAGARRSLLLAEDLAVVFVGNWIIFPHYRTHKEQKGTLKQSFSPELTS